MAINNNERRQLVRLAKLMREGGSDLGNSTIEDVTFFGNRFTEVLRLDGVLEENVAQSYPTLVEQVSNLQEILPQAKRGRKSKAELEAAEAVESETADETELVEAGL